MFRKNFSKIGGKVSIVTALLGVLVIFIGVLGELPHGNVAKASTATTSVTVLNTPPTWDTNVYVQETVASATSSPYLPTNSGNSVNFYASATDSSLDNYYLLICNNYASPTPVNNSASTCSGGNAGHLIAVSAATVSGTAATAATSTYDADPTELFYYYGYVCDNNSTAACNSLAFSPRANPNANVTVSTTSPYLSPFVVNHRPTFTGYVTSAANVNPGGTLSWYATATDADTFGGASQDTVKLFLCKAQDFTGSACGPGGLWASSTFVTQSATATVTLVAPNPKGTFGAYGYVVDAHGTHSATTTSGKQTTDAPLIINNVAPTIAGASVSLLNATDTNPIILTNLATATLGFRVQYTVTDQNSCQTASGTAEILFGTSDIYRSGITQAGCSTAANANTNNCYIGTSTVWTKTIPMSCTPGACAGTSSATQVWTCTFPLWFNADATDAGSFFPAQNWLAAAQAGDSSFATSTFSESTVGTELLQFLGYDISRQTIDYGGLQPGQDSGTVGANASTSVRLLSEGNVGLDETLYGDDMCPTYPVCTGNATSTIFVSNQHLASSTVLFAFATTSLSLNPGALFALHVPKTIATSTLASSTTYWGIAVPGAITLSGSYVGRNTIIGATSPSSSW